MRELWGDWHPRVRAGVAIVLIAVVAATAFAYARKLDKGMSAFVRWHPQVNALVAGEDVYRVRGSPYPNPPLMGVLLAPLAQLPVEAGAWAFFWLKVVLAGLALVFALEAVASRGPPLAAPWAIAGIALSLRPIVSDLQHGNVNILILFLVMAGARALARGRDVAAGLWVALATCLKVTPGIFVLYFAYKRWWRTCAAFAVGGVALSMLPGLVLGFGHTVDLLVSYYHAMLAPFSEGGTVAATLDANQSLGGVLHRYLADVPSIDLDSGPVRFNPVSLELETVQLVLRGLTVGLLALLAWVCRSPGDVRGLRIVSEYGLVVIAMLMISPRTWKHHYVVMALPYLCVLAWAARDAWRDWRGLLIGALVVSQLFVISTSRDVARIVWFVEEAHNYALGLGAYLFSAVVVFAVLAAVLVEARRRAAHGEPAEAVASARPGPAPAPEGGPGPAR